MSALDRIVDAVLDAIVSEPQDGDRYVAQLAKLFCSMSDDGQARFFSDIAITMRKWGGTKMEMQAHYIGRHLRDCTCATSGRDFVQSVFDAMCEDAKVAW